MICKHCSSKTLIKRGFTKLKKQKFFCKNCKKFQLLRSDQRKKYDEKVIQTALILFSEGNNYRRIARILSKIFNKKISYQLIIKWIKNKVATLPLNTSKNEASRQIEIIEMDELYTFFKNEKKRPEFGLLLTETRCVCLHFM